MMDWVTDVSNMNGRTTPLKFRFLAAMNGLLGISANLNKWSSEDFGLATQMVIYYKGVRDTVQLGKLYHLLSPPEGELTANEFVSTDGKQVVLFAFLHSQQFLWPQPRIYLRGLDENALYRAKTIDNKLAKPDEHGRLARGAPETLSGSFLMHHGLTFNLTGDFDSTSVTLEKVE